MSPPVQIVASDEKLPASAEIVVIGAGPTGVEMAGTLAEIAKHTLSGEFRHIDPASAQVLLVEGGPRVLQAMPESLSQKALEQLFAPSRYSFPLSQGMSTSMTMAMSMARTGKDPLLHTIDSNSIITAATTNGTVDDKNDMDPIKGVNIKMEPSLPTSIESDGDADGDVDGG
eukprot:gene51125-68443_t